MTIHLFSVFATKLGKYQYVATHGFSSDILCFTIAPPHKLMGLVPEVCYVWHNGCLNPCFSQFQFQGRNAQPWHWMLILLMICLVVCKMHMQMDMLMRLKTLFSLEGVFKLRQSFHCRALIWYALLNCLQLLQMTAVSTHAHIIKSFPEEDS